jgi:predicted RNA-binding Zn ribbon-like protein
MSASGSLVLVMVRYERPDVSLAEAAQAAGFVVGGEPLAVDLADTVITVSDPPTDLLADEASCKRFWALQAGRLPDGWAAPSLAATRRLRDAIRGLLDGTMHDIAVAPTALELVNRASGSVSTVLQAVNDSGPIRVTERWNARQPADLALGAAARSAIALLGDPSSSEKLRRCANPNCSMLFVHGDARRQWCTGNLCGNRTPVGRYQEIWS